MNKLGTYSAIRLGPDKRPSNGTTIATAQSTGGGCPPEIDALWVPGEVVIAWNAPDIPRKRLSPASLGSVRRKRLMRRLEKKHPLFAAQLFEAETTARKSHFWPENGDDK